MNVSIKGLVLVEDDVLLCRNDRDQWELPGGRIEAGEDLRATVEREVWEESQAIVRATDLLDAQTWEVLPGRFVVLISYRCAVISLPEQLVVSPEHTNVVLMPIHQALSDGSLPEVYKRVVVAGLGAQDA